jgi:hypothetical protein
MKNFLILMMAVALSSAVYAQSSNADDAVAVAKARAAVQASCLSGAGNVSTSVWQDLDGTYHVYFFNTFTCPPNQICPLYFRIAPLAHVTLDADYNVLTERCWFSRSLLL